MNIFHVLAEGYENKTLTLDECLLIADTIKYRPTTCGACNEYQRLKIGDACPNHGEDVDAN